MSEQQQPKTLEETLDDIQTMSEGIIAAVKSTRVQYRSRPINTAPEREPKDGCELNESCEGCTSQPVFICAKQVEKDTADATAAENKRVLKEVYDEMLSSPLIRGDCMRDAIKVIESLRSQQ